MPDELFYTSVPAGLKPGASGYCTVAATEGIATRLSERLESLSGYNTRYATNHARSAENPIGCQYLQIDLAGKSFAVLSRASSAGLDYTNRTNFLVCHLALGPNDPRPQPGPAWTLSQRDWHDGTWDHAVGWRPAIRLTDHSSLPRSQVCWHWQWFAGDAGWAGAVADELLANPRQSVSVILNWDQVPEDVVELFADGRSLLPLVCEVEQLLPPAQRWSLTFNTYFGGCGSPSGYRLRFILSDSPEAEAARQGSSRCFDFTRPATLTSTSKLVEQARNPQASPAAEPAPATARAPVPPPVWPAKRKTQSSTTAESRGYQQARDQRRTRLREAAEVDELMEAALEQDDEESNAFPPPPIPSRREPVPVPKVLTNAHPGSVQPQSLLASPHLTWMVPIATLLLGLGIMLIVSTGNPDPTQSENKTASTPPENSEGPIAPAQETDTLTPTEEESHKSIAAAGRQAEIEKGVPLSIMQEVAQETPHQLELSDPTDALKPDNQSQTPKMAAESSQPKLKWPPQNRIEFSTGNSTTTDDTNRIWEMTGESHSHHAKEWKSNYTWRFLFRNGYAGCSSDDATSSLYLKIEGSLHYLFAKSCSEIPTESEIGSISTQKSLTWTYHPKNLATDAQDLLRQSLLQIYEGEKVIANYAFQKVVTPELEGTSIHREVRLDRHLRGDVVVVHVKVGLQHEEAIAIEVQDTDFAKGRPFVPISLETEPYTAELNLSTPDETSATRHLELKLSVREGTMDGNPPVEISRIEIYNRLRYVLTTAQKIPSGAEVSSQAFLYARPIDEDSEYVYVQRLVTQPAKMPDIPQTPNGN